MDFFFFSLVVSGEDSLICRTSEKKISDTLILALAEDSMNEQPLWGKRK